MPAPHTCAQSWKCNHAFHHLPFVGTDRRRHRSIALMRQSSPKKQPFRSTTATDLRLQLMARNAFPRYNLFASQKDDTMAALTPPRPVGWPAQRFLEAKESRWDVKNSARECGCCRRENGASRPAVRADAHLECHVFADAIVRKNCRWTRAGFSIRDPAGESRVRRER